MGSSCVTHPGEDTKQAFRSVVKTDLDAMYRTALRMMHDRDEAEDAVQEALHKAWRKIGQREAGRCMKPWLFKILVNTCLDHLRSRSRRATIPYDQDMHRHDAPGLDGMQPDDRLSNTQLGRQIDAVIAALSEEHRAVALLIIVEQFSYEDAATALGVPVGTVRSRLSRARAQLSGILRPMLDETGTGAPGAAVSHLKLVK